MNSAIQYQSYPTKIIGTYNDDYDIIYVNDTIINYLSQEKNKIPDLNDKLKGLKKSLLKLHTLNVKREIESEIIKVEKEIESIKNNEKLTDYKLKTKDLIEEYIKCKINNLDKLKIIDEYLRIAKNYIQLQVTRITNNKKCCKKCKHDLENISADVDGILRCPNCHNEHQSITTSKHLDFKVHQLSNENDMENFIKALNRYQGLQTPPPKILFTKLDAYFKERGFPSAEEIKKLPYNDRGKKGNTNKEMLYTALSNIGYSTYYEDVNLIGNIYWGWKLNDISSLQEKILRNYMVTQKSFYKIPPEVRCRLSSLGTSFLIKKHLELVGVPVYHDDFKIAENPDSVANHKKLWKMMCELANDEEIYYID